MLTSSKHNLKTTHKENSYGEARLVSANLYSINSKREGGFLYKDRTKVHNDETFV